MNFINKSNVLLFFTMFIGLVLRIYIIWQPIETLSKHGQLIDDSFISFTIARNIAEGKGITFDGIQHTNGYQPLWVFLSVPFFIFFKDALAVRLIMLFSVFLSIGSGILLYRFLKKLYSKTTAWFALIIWLFNPIVLRHTLNGLETGLYIFFLIALINQFTNIILQRNQQEKINPSRQFVLFFIILSLTILTRIDSVFLVPIFFILFLIEGFRFKVILKWITFSIIPLIVWTFFSVLQGSPLIPESGQAVRLISLLYGNRFCAFKDLIVSPEHISPLYLFSNILYTLNIFEAYIYSLLSPFLQPFIWQQIAKSTFFIFPGLLSFLIAIFWLYYRRNNKMNETLLSQIREKEIIAEQLSIKSDKFFFGKLLDINLKRSSYLTIIAFLFSFQLIVGYSFYTFGQWFYHRYYFPIFVFLIIGAAIFIPFILSVFSTRKFFFKRKKSIVISLMIWISIQFFFQDLAMRQPALKPLGYTEVTNWLNKNTPIGSRIGCFQAGTIAFLSPLRTIICLDGVVNRDARRALETGTMTNYIIQKKISLVVDWDWVIDALLKERSFNNSKFLYQYVVIANLPDHFKVIKVTQIGRLIKKQ